MAYVFGMARFRLGSHGLRVDRGRLEGGQHLSFKDRTCKRCSSPSLVDDEHHARLVCPSTACVRQDFSEVMQQCSLGSPELSLKALMAYPDENRGIFCISLFKGGSTASIACLGMTF
jgi:ribosomal protein S27AE